MRAVEEGVGCIGLWDDLEETCVPATFVERVDESGIQTLPAREGQLLPPLPRI